MTGEGSASREQALAPVSRVCTVSPTMHFLFICNLFKKKNPTFLMI